VTESVLTPQQAHDLLHYWKKILRIQDWDVEVRIVRAVEFHLADSAGECHTFALKRRAIIHLLHQDDWKLGNKGIFARPPDHEYTLVHELLHIVLNGFTRDIKKESPEDVAHEQAIDAIAEALLALHRSAPRAVPHVPLGAGEMALPPVPLPLDALTLHKPHLAVSNPSPVPELVIPPIDGFPPSPQS
jgi:hypothetical protein